MLQLAAGLLNVVLLAPIWMQMMHLLVADLVWIAYVLMAARTLGRTTRTLLARPHTARPRGSSGLRSGNAWADSGQPLPGS